MSNKTTITPKNKQIILGDIYIPNELFGRIVDCLHTSDLWKSGLAFTCRLLYVEIFYPGGLLSRRVESDSTAIVTEMRCIKSEYNKGKNSNYFSLYDHKHPNSFLDVVGKLLFGLPLADRCVESLMFTAPYLKNMVVNIYQKAISPMEGHSTLLRQNDMKTSFKLLMRTTEQVKVKLNYISFWLDLWQNENTDTLKLEMAKAVNLILFGTSSAVSIGAFDGHFSASTLWIQHPHFLQHPHLLDLKIKAWNCLKTCQHSQNTTLKAELAIAAGLICLSNHPITIELQKEALAILTSLSYSKSALVLKHIAHTIILLNKHTEGGFDNLSDEVQSILITIFHRLLRSNQKTVISKVNKIDLFINCSAEHKTPQLVPMDLTERDYIVIDESDTEEPEPPAKRLKSTPQNEEPFVNNEEPFIIRHKRPLDKDNSDEEPPTKRLKKEDKEI